MTEGRARTARLPLPRQPSAVPQARHYTRAVLAGWSEAGLADDAELLAAELVTNAVLHSGEPLALVLHRLDHGVRLEVEDASRALPSPGRPLDGAMTGRGMLLIDSLAAARGVELRPGGKVIWCELWHDDAPCPTCPPAGTPASTLGDAELAPPTEQRYPVRLGKVSTALLLSAKTHVDNLLREFTLASAGHATGQTAQLPPGLAALVTAVSSNFAEAREGIRAQGLAAAQQGWTETDLTLHLPLSAVSAGRRYLQALDELDSYGRSARLLTLATPPEEKTFRHWYVESLIGQLEAIARGEPAGPVPSLQEWSGRG